MEIKIQMVHAPENPRQYCELSTVFATKGKNFGADEDMDDAIDWLEDKLGLEPQYDYSYERLSFLKDKFEDKFIAKPVYAYSHGGTVLNTKPYACGWDSGLVGYIYYPKNKLKEDFGSKIATKKLREKALNILTEQIRQQSEWINGEVYEVSFCEDYEEDECMGPFYGFANEGGMYDAIRNSILNKLYDVDKLIEKLSDQYEVWCLYNSNYDKDFVFNVEPYLNEHELNDFEPF